MNLSSLNLLATTVSSDALSQGEMRLALSLVGGTKVGLLCLDFTLAAFDQILASFECQSKAIGVAICTRSYSLAMQNHVKLQIICSGFDPCC